MRDVTATAAGRLDRAGTPLAVDRARERSEYRVRLRERVMASGADDWMTMLRGAQGATPAEVVRTLGDASLPIPEFRGEQTVSPEVPEGHLAHFEWFFDQPTAAFV